MILVITLSLMILNNTIISRIGMNSELSENKAVIFHTFYYLIIGMREIPININPIRNDIL